MQREVDDMANRILRMLRVMLICVLALAICGAEGLAASVSVKVNADDARVYESASASSKSVEVPKDLVLTLKACSNGWGKVTYQGNSGFIKLKYLDRLTPVRAYVTENAMIYRTAGDSKQLAAVSKGTEVYVIGVDGGYARVSNRSGSIKGYIKSNQLTGDKPQETTSSAQSSSSGMPSSLKSNASKNGDSNGEKIEYAIYVAQNQLGKPYSADPVIPDSFDCAAFTQYCYGMAEKDSVKSSPQSQGYDDRMPEISYSDLARGDLVCFDTVSNDSDLSDHVGIYLGEGYFIHASSSAGKVIVSSMKSGYYKNVFSWGRRVFGK